MAESHIRIDEGVKRGPRTRQKAPRNASNTPVDPSLAYDPQKLVGVDINQILTRYLNGETSTQIAKSLNCTRQGLGYFLRENAEEDWKNAQVIQAIERKEQAEDELGNANDSLSLARARERLRSAQWELERVCNRIFGQKQEVSMTVDIRIQVDHCLTEDARSLLERVRTVALIPTSVHVAPLALEGPELVPTSIKE